MNVTLKAAIAAVCALGLGAAYAQTVQRGETSAAQPAQQTVAQAPASAPIQTAQAGAAAGGAAGGASGGGFAAGIGTAGTIGSTTVFVGSAVAGVAGASGGTYTPPSH